ncbi:MAG TPA: transposase [Dissulfurispiraceae bacterium]|nr:transposase [Dissulfurispiraceae bacterium]
MHHRKTIRLKGYDYSQAGAYFVTICTKDRECLLGNVTGSEMHLNEAGGIVRSVWNGLPDRFPGICLDEFIVMPNHMHGIIVIIDVGAGLALPVDAKITVGAGLALHDPMSTVGHKQQGVHKQQGAASSAPTTLGDVVRAFKSIAAINVNRLLNLSGRPVWQRNYYEHIVRNEAELDKIRKYIADNPFNWGTDENYNE